MLTPIFGEEARVLGHPLFRFLLINTRSDRPEPHGLAIALDEAIAVGGEFEKAGLAGLLLVEIAQIEQGLGVERVLGMLKRPGGGFL